MRELHKTAAFIGVGTIFETFTSLISVKIIALVLGPAGVGIAAQINMFYGVAATIAEMGLLVGITRFVADAYSKKDNQLLGAVIGTGFIISTLVAVLLIFLSYLYSGFIAQHVFGDAALFRMVWIISPGLVFASLYRKGESVFQGLRSAKLITSVRIIVAIIASSLDIILALAFGLTGIAFSEMFRQVLAGILVIIVLWRTLSRLGLSLQFLRIRKTILFGLFKISISTLSVSLSITLSTLFVRTQIVNLRGLESAGLFQAAWGLIFMATTLALSTLSYYTFPKVSALSDDPSRCEVMNESLAFGVMLVTASCLAFVTPRELIMQIFFRNDFNTAGILLPFIGLGAVFYIAWWIVGTPLVPKGRLFALVILNAIPSILFPLFTLLFLPLYNLIGVGIAYITANLITLTIMLWDQFRSIKFSLSLSNILLLMISISAILCQLFLGESTVMSMVARVIVSIAWFITSIFLTRHYLHWAELMNWVYMRIVPRR